MRASRLVLASRILAAPKAIRLPKERPVLTCVGTLKNRALLR